MRAVGSHIDGSIACGEGIGLVETTLGEIVPLEARLLIFVSLAGWKSREALDGSSISKGKAKAAQSLVTRFMLLRAD
jgi:hypothetical protein